MTRRVVGIDKTHQAYEMDEMDVSTTVQQRHTASLYVAGHAPREQVREALQMLGLIEDLPSGGPKCSDCGRASRYSGRCSMCRKRAGRAA